MRGGIGMCLPNAGTPAFGAAALAVAQTPEQVVAILTYVIEGKLAGYTDTAQAAE